MKTTDDLRFLVLREPLKNEMVADGMALLKAQGRVEIVEAWEDPSGLDRLLEGLARCEALLLRPWKQLPLRLEEAILDGAPNLRVVAGTFDHRHADWADLDLLAERGIALVDTSRSMTPSVAEFAFAMTLNLLRDIPFHLKDVRQGKWRIPGYGNHRDHNGFVHGDLAGRRIGLAGLGSINRRYAQFAGPFDCDLRAYDAFVSDETFQALNVARAHDLKELAAGSEIFVVGIPPTPKTQGIISRDVLEALPKGSLLVLVTRMAVMDQEALWSRVREGTLRVAVDVFDPEPPPADAWFRSHPHCLATPHIAGGVFYCHARCFTTACRDAIVILRGEMPHYAATGWDAACYKGKATKPRAKAT